MDADDDALLVQRACAGDMQAFEQLVRRSQSRVRQQLRRLVNGDAALADDLAQETFVQAWRQLPSFRFESRFSTWLHRVAYTSFLMHLRRRRDEPMPAVDAQAQESPGTDPALRLDVARAIDGLPEHERVALQHCYWLDLSHEEAASVLGLPLGTLKSHVARAKVHLRQRLAAWQPERSQ